MASATARPSFTFSLSSTSLSQSSLPIRTIKIPSLISKYNNISTLHINPAKPSSSTIPKSLDVSQEDKPTIPPPSSEEGISSNDSSETTVTGQLEDDEGTKFDNRRLEEKFAVLNTGIYECRSCGFKYDEAAGDPSYPIPPGLPFDKLPDDWRCPTCGASQNFFESKRVEIAGFAQNQQFGLGGNTLTSGQKALLIYGGLGLGFLFFLSGYLLQ